MVNVICVASNADNLSENFKILSSQYRVVFRIVAFIVEESVKFYEM